MIPIDLRTFAEKIEFVRRLSMGLPKSFDIDLSVPITDQLYGLAGNLFYILHAPDDTVYVDVKYNAIRETPIRLHRGMGFVTPFDKVFITTPAGQAGTIVVVYGTEAPELLRIIDNRSSTSLGINQILGELQGDTTPETWGNEITVGNAAAVSILALNANRKAGIIQAKSTNAGIVYLGFDNTVATNKWVSQLQAGMVFTVDDYRGAIWARADAVGQLVGFGEW